MSWVDDEANMAIGEDEDRRLREQSFEQQAPRLWNDLFHQVEQDVIEINENQELLRRRLGGERLKFQSTGNGFEVTKLAFPAVYLRISYHGKSIAVERETVTYEQGTRGRSSKARENISIELDQSYRPVLVKGDGSQLTVVEASKYLILPSLNMQPR